MEEELLNQNPEQAGHSTPEENGERLFTQAEVNKIVGDRLKRAKQERQDTAGLEAREAAVTAKESALNCREYLMKQGYPRELFDVLDTTNFEKFSEAAEKLVSAFGRQGKRPAPPLMSYDGDPDAGENAALRSAFAGSQKHSPAPYPPRPNYEEY